MFGIGPQELLIIGLLALIVFGPTRAASMARDFGRFVSGAQDTVEDFKGELLSEEVREARRTVGEVKSEITTSVEKFKDETRHSIEELKVEVSPGEKGGELAGDSPLPDEDETRQSKERRKPLRKEEASPPKEAHARKKPEQRDQKAFEGFSFGEVTVDTRRRGHKPRHRPRWKRLFGGAKH